MSPGAPVDRLCRGAGGRAGTHLSGGAALLGQGVRRLQSPRALIRPRWPARPMAPDTLASATRGGSRPRPKGPHARRYARRGPSPWGPPARTRPRRVRAVKLRELHHIAIVVKDIGAELAFYRDALGLDARAVQDVPEQRVRIAFLPLGGTLVELVQPTDDSSGVARFLAERGRSTMHHLCFAVDDLRGTLDRLAADGVELLDRAPRRGAEGDVAFLHPRAANGVLVELIDRASVKIKP